MVAKGPATTPLVVEINNHEFFTSQISGCNGSTVEDNKVCLP
jgi:hypothetical protein